MLNLYKNIKHLRQQLGMSQDELAQKTGYTSRSSIAKIEAGEVDLSQSKIVAFANIFNISPSELMGLDNNELSELSIKYDDYFPLHYCTNLSAGSLDELLDAEPDAVVYVPIKFQMMRNKLHAFKVNGTSMNNVIQDGSIVVVEDVSDFENIKDGTIVVAWINGSATIKRLYSREKQVTLMPDSKDKSHEPIFINLENEQVSIIGRVIWHMNPDDIDKTY